MQIFRDESGWRAFWTRSVVKACAAAIVTFTAALALLVLRNPALSELEFEKSQPVLAKAAEVDRSPRIGQPITRKRLSGTSTRPTLRYAFYDTVDERSFASLQENASKLDGIFVNWMEVDAKGITRRPPLEEQVRSQRWVAGNAAHLKKFAIFSSTQSVAAFSSWIPTVEQAQKRAARIVKEMKAAKFDGILVSFESADVLRTQTFASFFALLKQELAQCGCKLALLTPPASDLRFFALNVRKADLVVLATHLSAGGRSVPTQAEFETQLQTAAAMIPADKLIVGIGSYGVLNSDQGISKVISVYQSWALSSAAAMPLTLDQHLVGRFQYVQNGARSFDVRVLDGVTAFNHMRAALAQRPAGVALWQLGMEDSTVWHVIGKDVFPDASALPKLEMLEGMADLSGQIDGPIFSVQAVGKPGKRQLKFDASRGLIVSERLLSAPVSYTASNWGKQNEKRIALSFDDGPDERFTPQILDILKEKSARATFFVTGRNALAHPTLLRRIYNEGHDIGNHTFSHPDLAHRRGFEIDVELNATQRSLEKELGVRTKLFRAPYSSVAFETSPDGLRVLERASRLGYVSLRVTVDPYDWANISSEMIVNRVMSQIEAMEQQSNIVILLHDSGGNRKPTVEALPIIIDRLKASGHTFVAAHELLAGDRETFMPPVAAAVQEPQALAVLSGLGVDFYKVLAGALPAIALITIVLSLLRSAFVSGFAFVHAKAQRERRDVSWEPSVCVVVPAYNEEKVILKTIESVRASGYPNLDIVVVDDGSKDDTYSVVQNAYRNGEVRLFRVPNAGKASALNSGISKADADVIVAIDADTVLAPNAIERLVRHFGDPTVGAVAGKAVVGNERSIMAKFQALEYITSQNLDRRAFERFNAISVVPGALGAWRRTALVAAGGFREDTLAEDADATISIERNGYRVLYEPEAVAYTEAPETMRAFLKQRFRWMFGTLQVAFKHRAALVSKDTRGIGLIALPNILIFQIGFTLLAPIFDLVLVANFLSAARGYLIGDEIGGSVSMLAIYWIAFQAVDAVLLALAARLDGGGSVWRLVPYLLVQRFFYRQLLYVVAVKTLFAAVAGTFVGWGKLVRTGNVSARPA